MIWTRSHRFDQRARVLADRHYNRQKPGSPQFMPPGSCRVLLAANAGQASRRCSVDAVREIRDDCAEFGAPFFWLFVK